MDTPWILGIETSGPVGSVALGDGNGEPLAIELPESRRFAAALPGAVAELLARARIQAEELSALAVGCGPGSYTGMRVGAALASGLARGCGAELVGVCSFDAWAAALVGVHQGSLLVAADARRKRVYEARYALAEGWSATRAPAITAVSALGLTAPFPYVSARPLAALDACGGVRLQAPPAPPAAELIAVVRGGGGVRVPAGAPLGLRPLYLKATEAEERAGKVVVAFGG